MDTNQILLGRLKDLANKSYQHNIYTYTNFLSPADMNIFYDNLSQLSYAGYSIYGGSEHCDRVMVAFGNEASLGYTAAYPITAIIAEPLIDKFSDILSHRDFLGAIMNMGIEREMLGDIIVKESDKSGRKNTAYIFCVSSMADYIMENLTKVKHTNIKCTVCTPDDMENLKPEKERIHVICASLRIDAVVAAVTKLSRSQTVNLFREKKISLNNRLFENNSYIMKEDDTLSIRGYGKYIYISHGGETKKGRLYIDLEKYV